MSDRDESEKPPASVEIPVEAGRLHHVLGEYFLEIERNVRLGLFKEGADLLGEMIRLVKSHFEHNEDVRHDADLNDDMLGRLIHNAFVERARAIQSRCLNHDPSNGGDQRIHDDLVFLLSDIVEEDFRLSADIKGETP